MRTLPRQLHEKTRVKLARLHAAESLEDLSSLPGNRLENLVGDRAGQYSVRVNERYRICFNWSKDAAENVEVVDYH